MPVKVLSGPAAEPISLVETKRHLRIDYDDDDADIQLKITAARRMVEKYIERTVPVQTLLLTVDQFPAYEIRLPYPPVQSVTSVAYDDGDGVEQIVPSSAYQVDTASEPGWLIPGTGGWPSPVLDAFGSVRVTYVAGYDMAPAELRAAMFLIVGRLYGPRGDTSGDPVLDATVTALMQPYRLFW